VHNKEVEPFQTSNTHGTERFPSSTARTKLLSELDNHDGIWNHTSRSGAPQCDPQPVSRSGYTQKKPNY
jgi:hypothetical protein